MEPDRELVKRIVGLMVMGRIRKVLLVFRNAQVRQKMEDGQLGPYISEAIKLAFLVYCQR